MSAAHRMPPAEKSQLPAENENSPLRMSAHESFIAYIYSVPVQETASVPFFAAFTLANHLKQSATRAQVRLETSSPFLIVASIPLPELANVILAPSTTHMWSKICCSSWPSSQRIRIWTRKLNGHELFSPLYIYIYLFIYIHINIYVYV